MNFHYVFILVFSHYFVFFYCTVTWNLICIDLVRDVDLGGEDYVSSQLGQLPSCWTLGFDASFLLYMVSSLAWWRWAMMHKDPSPPFYATIKTIASLLTHCQWTRQKLKWYEKSKNKEFMFLSILFSFFHKFCLFLFYGFSFLAN